MKAFNLSEKYRTPVILLCDAVVGHLREVITLPDPGKVDVVDRARPNGPPGAVRPFAAGPDGVPAIPDFGMGYRYHITGLFHDDTGFPSTDPPLVQQASERLVNKIEAHREEIAEIEYFCMDDAEVAVIAYGCVGRSARAAVKAARARGVRVGLVRLITLWPFPDHVIQAVAEKAHRLVVAEMNLGDIAGEVRRVTRGGIEVTQVNRHDGLSITPAHVLAGIDHASPKSGLGLQPSVLAAEEASSYA